MLNGSRAAVFFFVLSRIWKAMGIMTAPMPPKGPFPPPKGYLGNMAAAVATRVRMRTRLGLGLEKGVRLGLRGSVGDKRERKRLTPGVGEGGILVVAFGSSGVGTECTWGFVELCDLRDGSGA
ncbi:hypothetical protein QBC40DRAFT_77420 [Triangularia verruculosa]|uniref:Uncharacterized protein n=1 Tax=Triangularia verruculosa TaxID=2587418 RepID=A0AAN6XIE8_9PEZI|nr:hypothetical protein QBC40DRAFT_77420 [Triangularia verruculosa]